MKTEDLQKIADYYLRLSDKLDGINDEVYNEDEVKKNRKGYSLHSFYGSNKEYPDGRKMGNLSNISSNSLLKAFFGDADELESIRNSRREELTESEIESYSINGNYLNNAQKDALRKALSNNVTIIQGPPGTGKTEVILNILSCIHKKYPEDTVMLLSGNYEAVKNITDKIYDDRDKNPLLQELFDVYLPLGNNKKRENTFTQRKEMNLDVGFFNSDYKVDRKLLGNIRFFSSTIHSVKNLYTTANDGNTQYDYVIVDECSQVSVLIGLIALSCGKRIILLGDKEQLAPIIKTENVENINNAFNTIPDLYKEMPEKSFLEACDTIFGGIEGTTAFLNEHYRCHPSIINFCNKFVYDGQLNVCTNTVRNGMADDNKLMVRVLWYEGDYFESFDEYDGTDENGQPKYKKININQRQIDIFMNEELLYIINKIREDKKYSVCVIAPYRAIIETLNSLIIERYAELRDAVEIPEEDNEIISRLTIHRVQGKGFDGVWFLSGQDAGSKYCWPWGQQKRMINVAVSRAKKEFTVITSSAWMPEKIQYELTNSCALTKPELDDEQDNLMINKIIEYVVNDCADLDKGERYGILKSKIVSMFDKNLYYRGRFNNKEQVPSAPELIMMDYLIERYSWDYDILREIPFSAYSPKIAMPECRNDFAICKDNNILVIVEVDGEYHRSKPEQAERDKNKDEAIANANTDTVVARISTNDLNVEGKISDALKRALNGSSFISISNDEKQAAVKRCVYSNKGGGYAFRLREVIDKCFEDFIDDFRNKRNVDEIDANNYEGENQDGKDLMYNKKMANDFYLCRYGMGYAFEYALIYQLVLKSMANSGEKLNGLLSIGCGSMIDGLSMAYANSLVNYSEGHMPPRFKYMGIDCKRWQVQFLDEKAVGDETKTSLYMQPFSEAGSFYGFAQDYLSSLVSDNTPMDYNVICFPKILNELSNEAANKIAECFSKLDFPLDEYYICATQSLTYRQKGAKTLKLFVEKINKSNEFEVIYDLQKAIGSEENILETVYKGKNDGLVFADEGLPCDENCYVFQSKKDNNPKHINDFDRNFQHQGISDYFSELNKTYDYILNPITTVSQITFQIVKLMRKKK